MIFRLPKASFVVLFKADFQMSLLGQSASTNCSLLMHSILVRIDGLKFNFRKQRST